MKTNYIDYLFDKGYLSQRLFEISDQNLTKFTYKILINTGILCELYSYQKSVAYNLSTKTRSYDKHIDIDSVRRISSIYRAKSNIKRIIDGNNFAFGYMPVFITYTFAEHITDVPTANKIWSLFVKRLNYTFKTKFRYLAVVEFQKSGRIHYHAVYFDLPYIDNIKQKFADIWGQGFVNVKAINHIKHIGGYVSKYLTKETFDSRLVGQKAFFTSRNVYKPFKIRDPIAIDNILKSDTFKLTFENDRKSDTYGLINYKKYKSI